MRLERGTAWLRMQLAEKVRGCDAKQFQLLCLPATKRLGLPWS